MDIRNPYGFILTLLLAFLASFSGFYYRDIISNELFWTLGFISGTFFSIFGSALVSYLQYKTGIKSKINDGIRALKDKDNSLLYSVVEFFKLEKEKEFYTIRSNKNIQTFIDTYITIFESCSLISKFCWEKAYTILNNDRNSITYSLNNNPLLSDDEKKSLSSVYQSNLLSSKNYYAGEEKDISEINDCYGLLSLSEKIKESINNLDKNPIYLVSTFCKLIDLSNNENSKYISNINNVDQRTKACLIDTILLGSVGLLTQQGEYTITNPDIKKELHATLPASIKNIINIKNENYINLKNLIIMIMCNSLKISDFHSLVLEIYNRWDSDDHCIFPKVFLNMNKSLIVHSDINQLVYDEKILNSAEEYFFEGISILRLNLAVIILNRGCVPTERKMLEYCLDQLNKVPKTEFFFDGIRMANAIFYYYTGKDDLCFDILNELSDKSEVYHVRKEAEQTLLTLYAKRKDKKNFERLRDEYCETAKRKGFLPIYSKIEEAAITPVMCVKWFFISIHIKKKFLKFYSSPIGSAIV